tara:strand:+ start:205 stop:504 length:300 start_codon:yes stop_codon:yes gene_type:complete
MKTLHIKGFNFSNPSMVFYNNVSEINVWKKIGLLQHTNVYEEWLNYLAVLLYHVNNGYTHLSNDDDDESERYVNKSIHEEIDRCKRVILTLQKHEDFIG